MNGQFLIWSNYHRAWWGPDSRGYTKHASQAGIYNQDDAFSIAEESRDGWRADDQEPTELAVPIESVPEAFRPGQPAAAE